MPATRDDGVKIWRLLPEDTSLGTWRLPLHSADARFGATGESHRLFDADKQDAAPPDPQTIRKLASQIVGQVITPEAGGWSTLSASSERQGCPGLPRFVRRPGVLQKSRPWRNRRTGFAVLIEGDCTLLRRIFFADRGLRAGWRLLIFLLLLVAFETVIRKGLIQVPGLYRVLKAGQNGTISPQYEFVFETALIAGLFLSAGIMARIERRPLGSYGTPLRGAFGKLFWQGAFWGLILESAEILGIYALHGFSFGGWALSGLSLLMYAVGWAIGFVLVGIAEEFLFRGYAQFTLAQGIGFWPAAVCLSALFGALHLGNVGEGWVGALSVTLFGLLGCFTLRRTGSLWFAIGLHAAVDYTETFIFSVPDSGALATGQLLHASLHGPTWLTGGTIGPEGSVLEFVTTGLAFVLFAWLYPANRSAAADHSA